MWAKEKSAGDNAFNRIPPRSRPVQGSLGTSSVWTGATGSPLDGSCGGGVSVRSREVFLR